LKVHIEEVNVEEILPVRQTVLRNGKPREECFFEGDLAEETIHLALYNNEELVAIASILKDTSEKIDTNNQYRLRGMAVVPNQQIKGYGRHLLLYAEDFFKKTIFKFLERNLIFLMLAPTF